MKAERYDILVLCFTLDSYFLAQLLSCKLNLCLCDHLLSDVRPSVNFGGTNLDG